METSMMPGSGFEYLMGLKEGRKKMGKEENLSPNLHLRDVRDGLESMFVTEIMGFAAFLLQTQRDKPLQKWGGWPRS